MFNAGLLYVNDICTWWYGYIYLCEKSLILNFPKEF